MTKPNPPWQTFATAPKTGGDNIDILAWDRTFGLSIASYHAELTNSRGKCGVWVLYHIDDEETVRCDDDDDLPEFWRPLPPGPDEEPENAKLLEICHDIIADAEHASSPSARQHRYDDLKTAIAAEGTDA